MSRLAFLISRLRRHIWLIPAIFTLIAVFGVPLAGIVGYVLPPPKKVWVSQDTLVLVMQVLATAMLPVATFSVAAIISAFHAISANATPRATDLAIADTGSQVALGTFIGTFLFAIVSLIALDSGFYGPTGFLILFLVTGGVVLFVAAALVRWVDHVSKLGLMSTTVELLERATTNAFDAYLRLPRRRPGTMAHVTGRPVTSRRAGYVQQIEAARLAEIAARLEATVHVLRAPGDRVTGDAPLVAVEGGGAPTDRDDNAIRAAFAIGEARTFENDPRFGLSVLSEIAERSLSPAVNDPGTAAAVIDAAERTLVRWIAAARTQPAEETHGVTVPDLAPEAVLESAFSAIARDGADKIEIALQLQEAYRALAAIGDDAVAQACVRQADLAAARAMAALSLERDRARLAAARLYRAPWRQRASA